MRALLTILCFILLQGPLIAQEDPVYHPIDKEAWKEATDGMDYYEEYNEPQPLEIDNSSGPLLSTEFLKIVAIIAVAALLVLIILKLMGVPIFGNKKTTAVVSDVIEDLDERPMESDLDRYLREALERGDYRLAVRIYYLMVLRSLNDRGQITWRKEKTNYDYLHEIAKHPAYKQVSDATLVFEYVWYGERSINNLHFERLKPGFRDLIDKIEKP